MTIHSFDLSYFTEICQQRINQQLTHWLNLHNSSERLMQAMRYSTLQGGKRFRPTLVYATTQALQGDLATADNAAVAVELIHAYSLIHDDLPAMDNDDLRRGQPTCHIAFDEATAILAGDALQSLAFEVLAEDNSLCAQTRLNMTTELAKAASAMVSGQALDMAAMHQAKEGSIAQLENIHRHKTGALIRASVTLGALAANADKIQFDALVNYADHLGLAFQIQDDALDVSGNTELLGKQQGADAQLNKLTYPALLGLEQAQKKAKYHHQQALDALAVFDTTAEPLRALAGYVIERHS